MKKILGIVLIVLAIVCFVFSAYNYINIEMVVSTKNEVQYDGFGEEYINGKPHSRHAVFMYSSVIGGLVLVSSGIGLLKKED